MEALGGREFARACLVVFLLNAPDSAVTTAAPTALQSPGPGTAAIGVVPRAAAAERGPGRLAAAGAPARAAGCAAAGPGGQLVAPDLGHALPAAGGGDG